MGCFDEWDDGRDDGGEKSFDGFGCRGGEEDLGGLVEGLGNDVKGLEVGDYHGEDCEMLVRSDDEEDFRHCFFTFEIGEKRNE